jgi:hypothetical protein
MRRVAAITFAPTGTANPFGIAGQLSATSAAIAPNGSAFVVRTYSDAYVWALRGGGVRAALARQPEVIALPSQPQGEGIAVTGRSLITSSEGLHSAVYAVPLPEPAPQSATRSLPVTSSEPAAPAEGGGGAGWRIAIGAAGAAVVMIVAFAAWRRRSH